MTRRMLTVALLAALTLGACDNAKPRHTPYDPFAAMPPEPTFTPPTDGLSKGLPRAQQHPGFSIDQIGAAAEPATRRPAVTPADQPIAFDGFGYDPVAKGPGKGLDLVVDGRAYGTAYGKDRTDVARSLKTPGPMKVGFAATLPAQALARGPHTALVRVVAADGAAYYESLLVRFQVR